jgi:SNF2 family DNA or RNA helicase
MVKMAVTLSLAVCEDRVQLTLNVQEALIPLWSGFSYFAHQETGIRWMLEKERVGTLVPSGSEGVVVKGGFQCDDMGLGKTIQIASAMVNHPQKATLLIAPLAMIETWVSVCLRAGMAVYQVEKSGWVRAVGDVAAIPLHFRRLRPTVYVSNYEKMFRNHSLFDRSWDRVVLDEAHKIRNADGLVAKAARGLKAPIRWAVTGTPLVNSLKDVVSLMAFVGVPCKSPWRWDRKYLQVLPHLLIHRSLNSLRGVIKGAPPVPEIVEQVMPFGTEEEEDFYHGVQGATESMVTRYARELLSPRESFKLLLRLRQISVHPQVYINAKRREDASYDRADWEGSSTKMEAIRQILDEEGTHKTILFCQFNDEMALIRDFLLAEGLVKDENILLYHGGLNQAERTAVLRRSKETTERTVLLLQLQAGGVGLNLQEYDRIVFMSPWWTAALMDQAIARAVRMGQTQVVKVFHLRLAAEHSAAINIDKLVNAKAEEKRKMLKQLFQLCGDF